MADGFDLKNYFSVPSLSGVVRSLFTLPTIGLPVSATLTATGKVTSLLKITNADIVGTIGKLLITLGIPRGIPIFASSQKEIGENSVGKQILLRAGAVGTQYVTDNTSPQPRKWRIEGYIAHPNVFITANIGGMSLQSMNVPVVIAELKAYFRYLRNLREPFTFITKEGESVPVLMESYEFTEQPESEWASKISLSVVEYIALSVTDSKYDLLNAPSAQSIFGNGGVFVGCAAKTISLFFRAKQGSKTDTGALPEPEKPVVTNAEEEQAQDETTHLMQLGVTDKVLEVLTEDTTHDTQCVVEKPFAELTEAALAYVTTLTFGTNSVTLSLHKTFSDDEWWIDEKGSVNGKAYTNKVKVGLNTYLHFDSAFTYIIVSPYAYGKTLKEQITCLANCSFMLRY